MKGITFDDKIYESMWLDTSSFSKNIKLISDELDEFIEFIENGRRWSF